MLTDPSSFFPSSAVSWNQIPTLAWKPPRLAYDSNLVISLLEFSSSDQVNWLLKNEVFMKRPPNVKLPHTPHHGAAVESNTVKSFFSSSWNVHLYVIIHTRLAVSQKHLSFFPECLACSCVHSYLRSGLTSVVLKIQERQDYSSGL